MTPCQQFQLLTIPATIGRKIKEGADWTPVEDFEEMRNEDRAEEGILKAPGPEPHLSWLTNPVAVDDANFLGFQHFLPPLRCTCSDEKGPCPGHVELICTQLLAKTAPEPFSAQQQSSGSQSLPTPVSRHDQSYLNESLPQPLFFQGEVTRPSLTRAETSENRSVPVAGAFTPPSGAETMVSESNVKSRGITEHFESLLQTMRTAGFQDFDQMILAYYTAQFEENSLPAISQRASRSRRLKLTLRALHERSKTWPKRESQGLYEGLVEMTGQICPFSTASLSVQELDRVEAQSTEPFDIEPESLLTTLGWLLFSREHNAGGDGHDSKENVPRDVKRLTEQMEASQDSVGNTCYSASTAYVP
ncbi:Basic-leucine zipper (bZIP) transcription factor [Fusarium austroafricanum]|uniref:Basic-leucine zipper (BZIP) transcription factor n=1 Tax=Fusarium austroafricanum TaxID=2364996 RepID=A0A8H4NSZ9_9HYPO|nr:Basic-leucine zipper (bZIP) transcription factor [Fusarium austroafricanum]